MDGAKNRRVLAAKAREHIGQTVEMGGWVYEDRDLGGVRFVLLGDRSGQVQLVLKGLDNLAPFGRQTAVWLTGRPQENPRAPGGLEVQVEGLEVLSPVTGNIPLDPARGVPSLEQSLAHRVLSLRRRELQAVFKIQAALARGFREGLEAEGFTEIHTPKIVGTGTEGGANLFPLTYFERRAFLAQSPQFYKEMLVSAAFERVYEVGPVFRAETHDTARHLNEYTSLDLEMGFIDGMDDLLALEARLLRHMVSLAEEAAPETPILQVPEHIPALTFQEAEALLSRSGKVLDGDLDPEAERLVSAHVKDGSNPGWVFVTHFPARTRPFYSLPDPQNPEQALSFDLILDGLEVTTGGMRHHLHGPLESAIRARGMNPEAFGAYMDAHLWGMPPHGGLAIGLERLTARLLGLPNVREATFFPRDRSRLDP